MQNFTFHNPTKIIFGKGTIPQVGAECAAVGRKVLLLTGKGSIKRNGVYDQVIASLREADLSWIELDGVKANPTLAHTLRGVELAKSEKVDLVLAVGGGSVVDEAKAICAGAKVDHSVWEFYMRKGAVLDALPLVAVLTMAATGSEMNGGTVITNEETRQKLGMAWGPLFPKCSILDPETLYSIPAEQTIYGCVDAMTHLLESYFTCDDPFTPLQDRYVEGIVRTIMEITPSMLEKPHDYQLRATFMRAATLAWNNNAPAGVGEWSTPNHLIGHSMSALHDTPHGASLSISLTYWLPWYAKSRPDRLARLGRALFDIAMPEPKLAAAATIEAFVRWFQNIGAPTSFADIGVDEADMKKIADNIGLCAPLWRLPQYTQEFMEAIFHGTAE